MTTLQTISKNRCWHGTQSVHSHQSDSTGTPMRFSVYVPQGADNENFPVVYFLSGLTCSEENATTKAGAQQFAQRLRLILVMPDTSPRGAQIPGEDDDWDLGSGASFYVDATEAPWNANYRMESYIVHELRSAVDENFPTVNSRIGITGHSMGGHGALTLALKYPEIYRSVSAFSPIVHPSRCPWGEKAFTAYLGKDRERWKLHDACELIRAGKRQSSILVDQGAADPFLEQQLRPQDLEQVCLETGQPLQLRRQSGYDHSYFFVQTFIGDHLEHHARALR
jgi:S-formylglutathione hydrolase